jgi:hypothetical protein
LHPVEQKKTRSFYLQYFQNFPGSVEAKKSFYLQYFQKNKTIILLTIFLGLPDFSMHNHLTNILLPNTAFPVNNDIPGRPSAASNCRSPSSALQVSNISPL